MGWEDWDYLSTTGYPVEGSDPSYTAQDAYYDGIDLDQPASPELRPPKEEKIDHSEYASRVRLYGRWNADKWRDSR